MKSKGHQHIFTWKQLLAVLAACLATLYFLLPDDPTLLESLIKDGKTNEAQRQLDQVSPEKYALNPVRYEVAQQKIDRLRMRDSESAADWEAYLLRSVERWRANDFAGALLAVWIDDVGRLERIDPFWEAVFRDWTLVAGAVQRDAVDRLVALALAHERVDYASAMRAATFGASPSEASEALELARLFRLQGKTTDALRALEQAESPAIVALRLTLFRELNQNEAALDQMLAGGPEGEFWTIDEIRMLTQMARGAVRPARGIPAVTQFLASEPENLEAWRLLVVLQRESGMAEDAASSQGRVVALSQRDPEELREWGRLLEGSGQPSKAFDVYLELAGVGDVRALERLVELNPGLFRDREVAELLLQLVPVPNHDDYTLLLARILAKLGRYDDSIAFYQRYLQVMPADREALFELGILAVEIYEYRLAVDVLQRIKDLGDNDVATIRRLGDAWVKLGENERALVEYRLAAEMSGEPDDYGSYFRLARALGDYEGFVAGLEGVVVSDEATASDYMTLAYGYQLLGQDSEAKRVMRDGMVRFPQNPDIPMRLGYALGDAKRFREAQDVMQRHPHLGTEIEPTRYYLLLMRLNNDMSAERRFLQRELADKVLRDPESQRLMASAYVATDQLGQAERMLRLAHAASPQDQEITAELIRVLHRRQKTEEAMSFLGSILASKEPAALRLAAEIFGDLGRLREAERYQSQYLEVADPVLPVDWGMLGDIRSSRGDFEGAKRAYRQAVQVFHRQLAATSETARP